jgi:hypothetical protein
METKPFWLSSEFYITVGTITAALAGVFPVGGKVATIVVGISTAAYAISRGLAKSGSKPS